MEVVESEFIEEALKIYPDLEEDFDELADLLHLQMDRFRYRTEEDIRKRDKEKVLQSYLLAEKCARYGTDALKNAVDTSYAEAIFAGHTQEAKEWAWAFMPEVLKGLYESFWGRNAI